jgi:hypothetical protein
VNAERNNYRQRRNVRRGRMKFAAYVMGRIATAGMLAAERAEKRAESIKVEDVKPLTVHYNHETDETVTLSESRREHWPEPAPNKGYPSDYSRRKGATLKVHSGIVKPVGFLGMLKGRLLGADGREI